MPKIAFSTLGCPDWTWFDVLRYGPQFGYNGVEIRLLAREVDLLQVKDLKPSIRATRRRELASAGFQVCGLASSVRFDYPERATIDAQIEIGRAYVEMAVDLGASFVRVFGDTLPTGDDADRSSALERIAEGLDRLGEIGQRAGVEILLETHGDFANSGNARELMTRVSSPAVGLLWDTHHPWRFCGEPIGETFRQLAPWVRHTHWKDSVSKSRVATGDENAAAAREAGELMSGHRHADYVLFGAGEFPARECMQALIGSNYGGWYSLEWERMWHPEIEGPEVALPPFPEQLRLLHSSVASDAVSAPPGKR